MATVLIVTPVFAPIAAGYAAVLFRFVSETAHKGISEFAFSIAIIFRHSCGYSLKLSDYPGGDLILPIDCKWLKG
jgi:hypothetical protein